VTRFHLLIVTVAAIVTQSAILFATQERSPAQRPRVEVGQPAPPLGLETVLQAPAGAAATWDALKGKAVVLEFWATWCAPCVAAIPHLNEVSDQFKDKPLVFIAVTDEKADRIAEFLKRRAIHGWIGLDTDRSMLRDYGIHGIQRTVLVDANGKVAGVTGPDAVTPGLLDKLLAGQPLGLAKTVDVGGPPPAGVEPGSESDASPPLFEIVVRPSKEKWGGGWTGGRGKLTVAGYKLLDVISGLHDVPTYRSDSKCDLPEERFDVTGLVPPDHEDMLRPLVRQAVETTFGLKTRREMRDVDAFVLTLLDGQSPKLTPTAMLEGGGSSRHGGSTSMQMINASTASIANSIGAQLKKPVLDETGLTGRYDVELEWSDQTPEGLASAVREQLGLSLQRARKSVEFLVIEKSE